LSKSDEFRRKAAECLLKANNASNEVERAGWIDVAEAWLRLLMAETSKATDRRRKS
jgi:hypothetical protein